jgi:hypothetical protein
MNDMERRKFEESFQDAFKSAEVPPSDKVWTNIELDLMKADTSKMKKRVLFYQLVAAASITFAVVMAGITMYSSPEDSRLIASSNSGNPGLTDPQLPSGAEYTAGSNTQDNVVKDENNKSKSSLNGNVAVEKSEGKRADEGIPANAVGEVKNQANSSKGVNAGSAVNIETLSTMNEDGGSISYHDGDDARIHVEERRNGLEQRVSSTDGSSNKEPIFLC